MENKERNSTVDILRGMAMLMVVLGHTMTGCTNNSQQSFLFNVVWSLQMPLFILISGYVTRYSRVIVTIKDLAMLIKKRTVAYLLPWVVWTIVVRGVIFAQESYLDIKWLLWNMDSGYWFLFTIWSISLVFGISSFLCQRIIKEPGKSTKVIMVTGVFYVIGMIILAGVGLVAGFSFLGIKLTLYYMPFFFTGYIYGKLQEKIYAMKHGKQILDCVISITLTLWLFVIERVSLYDIADSGIWIILRAGTSLCGCIAVCAICAKFFDTSSELSKRTCWFGKHSLEIYLIHGFFLNILKTVLIPEFEYVSGFMLVLGNFTITVILVTIVIMLLNQSPILKYILFGKTKSS